MLVLARRPQESIEIRLTPDALRRLSQSVGSAGVVIRVQVCTIHGDKARIGIDAPREFSVHRDEVQRAIESQLAPA